jgi:hypothetical protein
MRPRASTRRAIAATSRCARANGLRFSPTHYAGVADFEDRAATYAPFVRALIARVATANPVARFRSGGTLAGYWAQHLFLLAMVALLVFVLSEVGVAPLSESSWAKFAVIVGFVPLMIVYSRKNWRADLPPMRSRGMCCRRDRRALMLARQYACAAPFRAASSRKLAASRWLCLIENAQEFCGLARPFRQETNEEAS